MSIAIVGDGWWNSASEANSVEYETLPPPVGTAAEPRNPYSANAHERTAAGKKWDTLLSPNRPDAIIDNGAAGLAFVPDPSDPDSVKLFHERIGAPLLSHFIDPVVTVFQSLPFAPAWQCLQSDTWHKFVWDKPQTEELRAFGVPLVHYLPMAAVDRPYDTTPLEEDDAQFAVSFVGGQNTSYFYPQRSVETKLLLPGAIAMAVRSGMPDVSFFDIYFDLYKIAERPTPDEPLDSRINKILTYFNNKLFYNASQCINQRDRFAIFLNRKLGETFALVGENWDKAYGLACHPPFATSEEYLNHFRKTAVNLNFVNGNSDTGLNMRHFEITAAGGFMLCHHQDEIDDFFEVGEECDTFRTEQELLEKIRLYLEHPKRRIEMARAGQAKTLSKHLYSHRLQDMMRVISSDATPSDDVNAPEHAATV